MCCHVANAFLSRLELIWPISSMKNVEKSVFVKARGVDRITQRDSQSFEFFTRLF